MFTLHKNELHAPGGRLPSSPPGSRAGIDRLDRDYVFAFPAQSRAADLVYPAGTMAAGITQIVEKGRIEP